MSYLVDVLVANEARSIFLVYQLLLVIFRFLVYSSYGGSYSDSNS